MSPSGVEAFMKKQQRKEQQKAQFGGGDGGSAFTNDFRLQAGQYAVVRFLEEGEDLTFADTHRIPLQRKSGGLWYKNFVCLDTEDDGTACPACRGSNQDVAKRITRGFVNLIWREGPVYQRDENKRLVKDNSGNLILVGREDQIALWPCSWTVFETLKEKDSKFKGLMSRDWEVKRVGSSMQDTKYMLDPVDPDAGPQPMTIADLALAEQRYDLAELTKPMEYDALAQVLSRGATTDGAQPTMDRSAVLPTAEGTFEDGPSVRASAFTRG
jgi:hypothetical protein